MTHFILIIDESSGSFELSPFKIKQISKFKPKTLNLKMFEDVANGLAKEEALSFDPSLLNIVVKTPPKSDLLAFSNSSKEDSKEIDSQLDDSRSMVSDVSTLRDLGLAALKLKEIQLSQALKHYENQLEETDQQIKTLEREEIPSDITTSLPSSSAFVVKDQFKCNIMNKEMVDFHRRYAQSKVNPKKKKLHSFQIFPSSKKKLSSKSIDDNGDTLTIESITSHPSYSSFSFEELRLRYLKNPKEPLFPKLGLPSLSHKSFVLFSSKLDEKNRDKTKLQFVSSMLFHFVTAGYHHTIALNGKLNNQFNLSSLLG